MRGEPRILDPAALGIAGDAAALGRRGPLNPPRPRSRNKTEAETRNPDGSGNAAREGLRQTAGTDLEHRRRQDRRIEEIGALVQAEQRDRTAHRMGNQETRPPRRRQRLGEQRKVSSVAIETARARAARQAPGALGAALPAPVETPYRKPETGQIADRLEVFFDALGKASDHHTFRSWGGGR